MRYWCWFLLAGGMCVLAGCAFTQDVIRGMEPLIDAGAKFAADSAGMAAADAVKEHMPEGADPTAIVGGTSAVVMGLYMALKGAIFAWNRKPDAA